MSLLSGNKPDFAKALFLFAVIAFLALPVPSFLQSRMSVIGPNVAWATSPDETLKPPPTPPKRSASSITVIGPSLARSTAAHSDLNIRGNELSARRLFGIVWRVYWATVRL
jgi:hypothetical protein